MEQVLEFGAREAAQLFRDAELTVAALTHRAFAYDTADKARAACDRLAQTIETAAEIGAQSIIMTTGGRGEHSWSDAADRFAAAIAPAREMARAAGIQLGIEPTSHLYSDVSIAHRLSDTVEIARRAGIAPVIDIFACWFDADIERALATSSPLCPIAQISDYVYGDRGLPCRAVPGDGAIPFETIIPAMVSSGFAGWLDLEIIGPRLQAEGEEAGLRRAGALLGELLVSAGAPDGRST